MSNRHWLRAITKYKADNRFTERGDWLKGGATELSRVLEELTKEAPSRFAALLREFPPETNQHYYDGILRGMAEGGASTKNVLDVLKHVRNLSPRIDGRWLAQPLSKMPDRDWPKEALDIVVWTATSDPDPDRELWKTPAHSGQPFYGGEIHTCGINTARGSAAHALGVLLFADPKRVAHFLPALHKMVRDPSVAVRSCVALPLTALLNHDRPLAISLFHDLAQADDELLATPACERFLAYAVQSHYPMLADIVDRMMGSPVAKVRKSGAILACLAAFGDDAALGLAERAMNGDEQMRLGAAEVYSANVGRRNLAETCKIRLAQLFGDPSPEVRREASHAFLRIEGSQLGECGDLVKAFCRGPSFDEHSEHLLDALKETTANVPAVLVEVSERVLTLLDKMGRGEFAARGIDTSVVVELVIRVYEQAKGKEDKEMMNRCLDIIDALATRRVYGLSDGLAEVER